MCFQKRDLSDVTTPAFRSVVERILGIRGKFIFVCVARTVRKETGFQDQLVGQIIVYRASNGDIWRNQLVCELNAIREGFETEAISVSKCKRSLNRWLSGYACLCTFSLKRNGILSIFLDSERFFSSDSPVLEESFNENSQIVDALAQQMFYFLRDIGHRHQHHHPSTDTILSLYRKGDDAYWRRKTLYLLYRKIVRYKRSLSETYYSEILGILAYAKTFKTISLDDNPGAIFPSYQDENVVLSVQSLQRVSDFSLRRRNRLRDVWFGFLAFFVTFFFSSAAILHFSKYESNAKPPQYWISTIDYLISRPEVCIASLVGLTIFVTILGGKVNFLHTGLGRFWKNIVRLFIHCSRELLSILVFCVALLVFSLLIYSGLLLS